MQENYSPDSSTQVTGVRKVIVNADRDGQRIDNFLRNELPGVPKGRIYRLLRRGEVRVNGGRIKAKTAWNADTMRGDYGDFIVLDEFAQMHPGVWDYVVSPMMLDTDAGPEYWLGLHNFYVITRYNRSLLYAMAVNDLAEAIGNAYRAGLTAQDR